jgi:CheY-like chemotaxis protein
MSIFDDLGYLRDSRAKPPRTLFGDVLVRTGERGLQPRPFDGKIALRGAQRGSMRSFPRRARVLIVDDNVMFGEALVAFFEPDKRITVVGRMESGEAALGSPLLSQLDVVVADIGLPGIDGIELTRRLLAISPQLRVIILTGSDDGVTRQRALAAGAAAVLLKCGNEDRLVEAVLAVVDLPPPRDALGGTAAAAIPA